MPRPTTYNPDTVALDSFTWQIHTIAYVNDGDDATAYNTNLPFVEPTYGLVDHVQFLYLKSNDAHTRVNRLFAKTGCADTDDAECFSGHYVTGKCDHRTAILALDSAIYTVANTALESTTYLNNVITKLGAGYGTSVPVFTGGGVPGLINAADTVHVAIQKIAAQCYTNQGNVATLTTKEANMVSNIGTGIDGSHSSNPTYPFYTHTSVDGPVIVDLDPVLAAIGKIASDRDRSYTKAERIKDIVGRTNATSTNGTSTYTTYTDGTYTGALLNSALNPSPETSGDKRSHHQGLVLLDNFTEGALIQEERRDDLLNLMMTQAGSIVPAGTQAFGYWETFNYKAQDLKYDIGGTTAEVDFRLRRASAPSAPQYLITPSLAVGGLTITHVWLDPLVDDMGSIGADFEFWVNLADSPTIPPVGTQITSFRTWVAVAGGDGSTPARIITKFLNTSGKLRALRALFRTT